MVCIVIPKGGGPGESVKRDFYLLQGRGNDRIGRWDIRRGDVVHNVHLGFVLDILKAFHIVFCSWPWRGRNHIVPLVFSRILSFGSDIPRWPPSSKVEIRALIQDFDFFGCPLIKVNNCNYCIPMISFL